MDYHRIEEKWQEVWEREKLYAFDPKKKPYFVIDTPPPYPSGEFHLGNTLNWCYMDFVARYKRMRGYSVLMPQGWDVHGLPTEVKVENWKGKRASEVDRETFLSWCREWINKHIQSMKWAIKRLGFSCDWSYEYSTDDPDYMRRVQLSFLLLLEKGLVYRGTHPINWCPRCETAIADAEIEYKTRKTRLNYILFEIGGKKYEIATTRPELLHACVAVAVNPEDERYKHLIGKTAKIPLYNREVPIIAEEEVDPAFGTGIVMICTYGDKADVRWVKRHNLPVIQAIDRRGRIINSGRYDGLSIEEAREKILEDLKKEGLLTKQEELEQEVGVCWRCKTPIEILESEQWFLATRKLTEKLLEENEKVKWIPDHFRKRLEAWATSLDWDWVLSRQRIFGTPIPVWYCKKCGAVITPKPEKLPVDPRKDPCPVEKCPKCGGTEFEGEKDVFDTWFDSSWTIEYHAGWPSEGWEEFFPADLQPNGQDIIRTWDYYLLVRSIALFGKAPYKAVLINGMVMGEDGRKMSKSLGNYVTFREAIEKYPVDAIRHWAATGGVTGSDIPFSWRELEAGKRFMTKLYNAAKFVATRTKPVKGPIDFQPTDRWILSRLNRVIKEATERMEEYDFKGAYDAVRLFFWEEFCDYYIEEVKYRLYGESIPEDNKNAAMWTLRKVLETSLKLLAPFLPHITEEIWRELLGHEESIHVQKWPEVEEKFINEHAERAGEIINAIVSVGRTWKIQNRLRLGAEIEAVEIFTENKELLELLKSGIEDIRGTLRARRADIIIGEPAEGAREVLPGIWARFLP